MRVKEVMNSEVPVVGPATSLLEASRQFDTAGAERLFVVDRKRPIGVLTKQRLQDLRESRPFDFAKTEVAEVMQSKIVGCYEETDVEDAARVMRAEHLKELPVVNRYSSLVGRVSLSDLPPQAAGRARPA